MLYSARRSRQGSSVSIEFRVGIDSIHEIVIADRDIDRVGIGQIVQRRLLLLQTSVLPAIETKTAMYSHQIEQDRQSRPTDSSRQDHNGQLQIRLKKAYNALP